jgi:hypothetical protein
VNVEFSELSEGEWYLLDEADAQTVGKMLSGYFEEISS